MLTESRVQIRTLLHSGEVIEIGVRSEHRSETRHSRTEIVLGFAAIYLIWGSTYLGIRYAVETIPPLLMMGMRHSTAGALVYAWARRRGFILITNSSRQMLRWMKWC